MDPSPWKGECILVPWAEISNTSQSDLGASCQQEGGGCCSPPTSSSACLSSSWAASTQSARRKGTALSPQKWKKLGGCLLCWSTELVRGWERISRECVYEGVGGGISEHRGHWAGRLFKPHVLPQNRSKPSPTRDMMVIVWCSNHQRPKFQGTVTLSIWGLKLFTKCMVCKW